jgi:hypothetical protein
MIIMGTSKIMMTMIILRMMIMHHHNCDIVPAKSLPIISPREKRSVTEFDEVRHHHIVTKMALIHTLGNAGLAESRDHILSYMDPNTGTPTWRRAAIHSLRHFHCHEVRYYII